MRKIDRVRWVPFLGVSGLAIGAAATVAFGWSHARSAHPEQRSYLGANIAELASRLPPPPREPAVAAADQRAFVATRALQGSRRWEQAASDAKQSAPALLETFSCAAGVELDADRAPLLAELLATAGADSAHVASSAKNIFLRPRPYTLYAGPTCLPADNLGAKHDYPSGHAARGWTWALILAELLPDRRTQLMSRAKAYGESRVVCGFHSPTGVDAGRRVALLTVPVLMADAQFKADLRAASAELSTLRQKGQLPAARNCQSESTLAHYPY